MVKVLKTYSGFFVALPDEVNLTPEEVVAYKSSNYNNPKIPNHYLFKEQFPQADSTLTRHLQTELQLGKQLGGHAENELADNTVFKNKIDQTATKTNRKPLFADYIIANTDLPSEFAQSGIPLRRKEDFYYPRYDEKQQRYVCCDEFGNRVHGTGTRATFDFKTKEIFIHDKVFFFAKEDAESIYRINQKRKNSQLTFEELSPKEIALYSFYLDAKNSFCDKQQKLYSIYHELKHAFTNSKIEQRRNQPNYEELSPRNLCLFNEDDEKASHLQETYLGIAKWYKTDGNLDVFPPKCKWLVDKLKTLSRNEQEQLLANDAFIVNGNIENWNRNYAGVYTKNSKEEIAQVISLAMDQAYDSPALRMKDNDTEYFLRRSIAYTIDVYNPQTQKFESRDMSSFIKLSSVVREHNRQDIERAEMIVLSRRKKLEKEGITPELIASLQNGTYQEPFNTKVNTLQLLKQQLLDGGVSLKSKNLKGEDIILKANGEHTDKCPNGIKLITYKENKPIFSFVLDLDKKEYNCFNYRTKKSFSNAPYSKQEQLPEEIKTQIKKYLSQINRYTDTIASQMLQGQIKQK